MASWRRRVGVGFVAALVAVVASSPWWLRPDAPSPDLVAPAPVEDRSVAPQGPEQGPVVIRVLDPEGQPAPHAGLVADLSGVNQRVWWDTDEHGVARVDLPEGTVVWPQHRSEPERLFVGDGELVFQHLGSCPLRVEVVDPQLDPIDVPVEVSSDMASQSARSTNGELELDVPCGLTRVEAYAPDWPTASTLVDTSWSSFTRLTFRAGRRIHGRVVEPDGTPVEHVRLEIRGQDSDYSEEDGSFQLWVSRSGPMVLAANTGHHQPELDVLFFPREALELEHDVVVEPAHTVEVRCAGLEGDSCAWVPLLQCTEPHLPVGTLCRERGGSVLCRCPVGEGAIRGGGRDVRVRPDDEVVWLDFRDEGGLSGRVLVDGEPSRCKLNATRGLGLGVSGLAMRLETCDAQGEFALDNLEPGTWSVEVQAQGVQRTFGSIDVQGPTDLGDLELLAGTLITGVVVDRQTADPVSGVTVAAVALEGGAPAGAAGGSTDLDGVYAIRGLPAGEVEVFLPTDPLARQRVQLVETAQVDLVRDAPGDVSLSRASGDAVVTSVGPDAPPGLQVGDRIRAVELFGVDPDELVPGAGQALFDVLVGASDLPGVAVIVERDGEEWELD